MSEAYPPVFKGKGPGLVPKSQQASKILRDDGWATQALNFLGEVAGGSIPGAGTVNAGDFYYINATGGGFTEGNWAISDGTSWVEVASIGGNVPAASQSETDAGIVTGKYVDPAKLHGYVNPLLSTKALAPFLLFDGVTSSRRAEMTPGPAGAVAGMPASYRATIDVPAANPSANAILFYSGPNGSTAAITDAHALVAYIPASSASLVIRQNGADGAADARIFTLANFRTTYTGRIPLAFVFASGDSTTAPLAYIAGLDTSASFALTYGTGGSGTAPNWMPTTLDTTKFVAGYNWPYGRFVPHAPILGALTATEVLAWTQTGLLPTWCEVGTGSAVASYTSDFSAGVHSWVNNGPTSTLANATVDAVADALSVSNASASPFQIRRPTSINLQTRYRVVFDYYAETGSNLAYLFLGSVTNLRSSESIAVVEGAWQTEVVLYLDRNLTDAGLGFTGQTTATGGVLSSVAAGKVIALKNIKAYPLGPLAKWEIQPAAWTCADSGDNGIPLLLTSGVTAIGDKPDHITLRGLTMTDNGFILADQVVTPTGYELVAAYALQTGTETSTITVKETSSGGTTVATGALSASVTRVALTVSNGLLAGGKKLHLANSSWAGNTVTPFFVFRRAS